MLALALNFVVGWLIVTGRVLDAVSHEPVPGVTVRVLGTRAGTVTDADGAFSMDAIAPVTLRFSRLGYEPLEIVATGDTALSVELRPSPRSLESVVVAALRGEGAPISQRIVERAEIEASYFGQETPFLLASTPSVTSWSDAGSFAGYSYIRLRGLDQTRINITLDGVPLNEPEDQGLFFQNFPDFANSIESVQIQRGVGTSTNGTASYAGSVNFESIAIASARRGGELQATRGSFDTDRGSLEYQSGLLKNRTAFYGRYSAQHTDGFRHNSGNRSESFFGSAGWFGRRDIAKITAFSGIARNQMAYAASPADAIVVDPRDNPLTPAERDRFTQQFMSLAYTRLLSARATLAATVYGSTAGGDYDVAIAPDLYNFNLASAWYGALANWGWRGGPLSLGVGANASTYRREHFLKIRPDMVSRVYFNEGRKAEGSVFAKASYELGAVTIFGDVQARQAHFDYQPSAGSGVAPRDASWSFVNPKVGVTWQISAPLSAFASFGENSREPTRNDMFAGFDDLDATNVDFVGSLRRVRPERVRDLEAGLTWRGRDLAVQGNIYDMAFRNEIAPIGALSYIGLPLRKNVPSSYRRGVELDASYGGVQNLVVAATVAVSRNRIREYTDDASGVTFRDVEPLLTPRFLSTQSVRYDVGRHVGLSLAGRYVGRTFLSNTGDERFVNPPGYALDGGVTFRSGAHSLAVQANNLTNRRLYTGGYTDGAQSYYYPLASRSVFVTAKVAF